MVVPFEGYLENAVKVLVVEAFVGQLPPSRECSCMIYNSLEDRMVLLPNPIKRLVHPQLVGSETVDHAQRVVSSPLPCVL